MTKKQSFIAGLTQTKLLDIKNYCLKQSRRDKTRQRRQIRQDRTDRADQTERTDRTRQRQKKRIITLDND
jgi:hypothetical protein